MVTREDLMRFGASSGFQPDALEKVLHLLELLADTRSHPFVGPRVALKGGTALNLFALDVPRLSVDIDLNYIGAADRATMLEERPRLERALMDVCTRVRLSVHRVPGDFAGGKWRLSYEASGGGRGSLELDMNFILRTPLWPVAIETSRPFPGAEPVTFPVLDIHELAAGKLAALLARGASRDLFDARQLLQLGALDTTKLRLGFVVYGAANPVDWRTVSATGWPRRRGTSRSACFRCSVVTSCPSVGNSRSGPPRWCGSARHPWTPFSRFPRTSCPSSTE